VGGGVETALDNNWSKTKGEANRVYRQAVVQAIVTTEILSATLGPQARNDTSANCGSAEARGPLAQISSEKPHAEMPVHGEQPKPAPAE
jgi:hypothetical protein